MRPTRKQRNELLATVAAAGINPIDLDLGLRNFDSFPSILDLTSWSLRITHKPSLSKFEIGPNTGSLIKGPGLYVLEVIVGTDSREMNVAKMWSDVVERTASWANEVADYENTPDLWAELRQQQEFVAGPSLLELENTRFTSAEQAAIAGQLRAIKDHLKANFSLTNDQISAIDAALDEAREASGRIGRKDWRLLFMGAAFGLIVNDLVPPAVVQHILTMAAEGLGHMFGIGIALPPVAG